MHRLPIFVVGYPSRRPTPSAVLSYPPRPAPSTPSRRRRRGAPLACVVPTERIEKRGGGRALVDADPPCAAASWKSGVGRPSCSPTRHVLGSQRWPRRRGGGRDGTRRWRGGLGRWCRRRGGARRDREREAASPAQQDEAVFMLGACASFVSYMLRKHRQG